jgi:hypothetical protein
MEYIVDFNNCRAIILEGGEKDRISLTTVQDLAKIVALAVEHDGEWPVMGGMRGSDLSLQELFDVGERVRGTCTVLKTPSCPSILDHLLTSCIIIKRCDRYSG